MTDSLTKAVWKAIDDDVIIRRAIEKGIVSMKNLAVHLIAKHMHHANSDAVISAIRRYKKDHPLEKKFEQAKKVITQSENIRITTNIVEITLEKTRKTQELLQKAFSLIEYQKGEILLIIQGEESIKLMINHKNKERILSIFPKEGIKETVDNVAEVNIHLSEQAVKTPGILSVFCTELMVHDINIVEAMSCVPELLFFVRQKDVVKTYELLSHLCQG